MTTLIEQIINKYHGIAPQKVVNAVKAAAARTGADFSFLMEKASTESSFDPAAKSKTSTATGLFQFIESTWLNMVKEHGAKYGLGKLADQIQIRNGKPCVDNCATKDTILNLRKNPEIAALMAGEFSAGNKRYLEENTDKPVGKTELYLAHFMGAGGATKFLNSLDDNGDAVASRLFPKEAHANKGVFFDPVTKQPRTLNEIYDVFAQKFNAGGTKNGPAIPVPAQPAPALPPLAVAQALPLPLPSDIIWNDTIESVSGFPHSPKPPLSAENILILAQMQQHTPHFIKDKPHYNS